MVNEKPKNVRKKPVVRAESFSKKTTSKKKGSVKKKETLVKKKNAPVRKKKTPVKETTTSSSSKKKQHVAKKVIKKPAVKSKSKVSSVKKDLRKRAADENMNLKLEKASETQIEKVDNVIDKLSQSQETRYVTTVPGVLRKVLAVQEAVPSVHKELPIAGIINYLKKIF